jgi:metal-dependent amidase/aminoacylase/carboxypeptidase family protein
VIVLIRANNNQDKISKGYLFRCDIDALKFKEESGLEYCSQNGLHHACGHDAHTAILIMAIKRIALRRK